MKKKSNSQMALNAMHRASKKAVEKAEIQRQRMRIHREKKG